VLASDHEVVRRGIVPPLHARLVDVRVDGAEEKVAIRLEEREAGGVEGFLENVIDGSHVGSLEVGARSLVAIGGPLLVHTSLLIAFSSVLANAGSLESYPRSQRLTAVWA
jgi:hypothetical protein